MNKTALALALLIIMLACSLSNCNCVLAKTYTNVDQGKIASDAIWTKEHSPYILLGTATISDKAKLIIEPGVIIEGGVLRVDDGTLIAQGTTDQKVYFKNNLILNSKNTTIDNAVFVNSITVLSGAPVISNSYIKGGLTLSGGSPLINANIIDTRVFVTDGSPTISNNIISDGVHADARGGPVTISNNEITSKSGFKVIYVQGIHADITGNKIVGNNEYGIYAWLRITSVLIQDNQISNCTIGVSAMNGADANDVSILRNVIFNNDKGLDFYGPVNVRNNTIAQNRIGISATLPTISNNNFQNNSELNLEGVAGTMDATNNWWGKTDAQSIAQTIVVGKYAQVLFVPFLLDPNPNVPQIPESNLIIIPTVPPEPTATPIPTTTPPNDTGSVGNQNVPLSTVIVIAVLATILIIVFAGAFAYLKRRK